MNRDWRWLLVLGYPLLIVNILVALLYAVLWCGAHSWKFIEGCLTFVAAERKVDGGTVSRMVGNPGGQGWSPVVGFASETERTRPDLRVHEFSHVVQEMLFALLGFPIAFILLQLGVAPVWTALSLFSGGPLFALTYGAIFGYYWLKQRKGWKPAYYANFFERQAYERQARYLASYPDERETYWGHRG